MRKKFLLNNKLICKNIVFDYTENMWKYIYSICIFLVWSVLSSMVFANNSFQLVPESNNKTAGEQAISGLLNQWSDENFWDKYNAQANANKDDLGQQIQTGIFSRNSVLLIAVYVLRFIMQLAVVIWAGMLIKSGYTYALVAMGGVDKKEQSVSKPIKDALIWLFIISISYTIIKLLQMAFLS